MEPIDITEPVTGATTPLGRLAAGLDLFALNCTVDAARAGQAGTGIAVDADDPRAAAVRALVASNA